MKVFIDTNVFLRFLLADHKTQSPLAKKLFIDAYLKDVVQRLEAYKETNELDEQEVEAVNDVIAEADEIRKKQTRQTKIEVAKAFSKLWGKARKAGLEVYTEVRKEALKEVIKTFVKFLLEDPGSIFKHLAGLLD